MFYQILVRPDHRNSLQFLWWPNGDINKKLLPHPMRVHLFGATLSLLCASFALFQAAKEFGQEFKPYIASAIEESFYVDDFLVGVPNTEIGIEIMEGVKTLLLGADVTSSSGSEIVNNGRYTSSITITVFHDQHSARQR